MASARKRNVTGETKKTKNKVQTSKVNSVTSARLLWLAVVILILAVICGVYFAYKEKLLLKPSTSAQPKTSDPKTKSKTINKQQSKAKKTKTQSEITNKYDKQILKELHKAEKILEKGQIDEALVKFQNLVNRYPNSPRARYGLAQAFDRQSEKMQSNQILQKSIEAYAAVEQVSDCPLELKRLAMMRMANRLSFFGKSAAAVKVLERLHQFAPSDAKVLSELGVQYLLIGRNNAAKDVFRKVLKVNPNDGFAKSHLGFIIKTTDLNYEEAIPLLADGVHSGDQDAEHGRFYFHLGDALTRIGKPEEAYKVYGEAASKGIFLSAWQRSLYNADTPLKAQPWWTAEESGYAKAIRKLEANWQTIRDEGLAVINQKTGGFEPEEENLRHLGDWKQFTLYFQGRRSEAACKKTPRTCALVNTISDASGCTRGQIKYSIMFPGTHVWPHTGPTNCRLRAHLGLVIPEKVAIRVGNETRTWEEGKVVIIDDSFDHEVWHNGSSFRMILIVDFWHPDLTQHQRRTLSPI